MSSDDNPYAPPEPPEPLLAEQASGKLFSFAAALELFVVLAIVLTLISLLLPLVQ